MGNAAVSLGDYFSRLGKPTDAEPYLRETLESYEGDLGLDHNWTLNARSLLGACLAQQGRYGESEPLLVSSFEGLLAGMGPQSPFTLSARQRLVDMYELWEKPEKAAQYRDLGGGGGH